jgi:hypothetical protein
VLGQDGQRKALPEGNNTLFESELHSVLVRNGDIIYVSVFR